MIRSLAPREHRTPQHLPSEVANSDPAPRNNQPSHSVLLIENLTANTPRAHSPQPELQDDGPVSGNLDFGARTERTGSEIIQVALGHNHDPGDVPFYTGERPGLMQLYNLTWFR